MTAWIVIAVVVVSGMAFASGYYIGKIQGESSAGIAVIDDYGRTIQIRGVPDRIVTVAPTPTEIVFAVGAGDLVVGVDDYSDYPSETASLPKVGNIELNTEMILALRPDLIISSDLVPIAQLQQIDAQGIPYIILAARSIEDVFKDIRLVGFITGHVSEANAVVEQLEGRVAAVTAKTLAENVTKPRVYVEYYPMWTYGPGSFGDDLIRLAGGANVASNTSAEYVVVTDEFVIAQDPEIIVYTIGSNFNGTTAETISERTGWSGISAVVSGNIHPIDDNLISRYGPRIVDALEQLAELVHPELF